MSNECVFLSAAFVCMQSTCVAVWDFPFCEMPQGAMFGLDFKNTALTLIHSCHD